MKSSLARFGCRGIIDLAAFVSIKSKNGANALANVLIDVAKPLAMDRCNPNNVIMNTCIGVASTMEAIELSKRAIRTRPFAAANDKQLYPA